MDNSAFICTAVYLSSSSASPNTAQCVCIFLELRQPRREELNNRYMKKLCTFNLIVLISLTQYYKNNKATVSLKSVKCVTFVTLIRPQEAIHVKIICVKCINFTFSCNFLLGYIRYSHSNFNDFLLVCLVSLLTSCLCSFPFSVILCRARH